MLDAATRTESQVAASAEKADERRGGGGGGGESDTFFFSERHLRWQFFSNRVG